MQKDRFNLCVLASREKIKRNKLSLGNIGSRRTQSCYSALALPLLTSPFEHPPQQHSHPTRHHAPPCITHKSLLLSFTVLHYLHFFMTSILTELSVVSPAALLKAPFHAFDQRLYMWLMYVMNVQQSLMSKSLCGALIHQPLSPAPYNGMRTDWLTK